MLTYKVLCDIPHGGLHLIPGVAGCADVLQCIAVGEQVLKEGWPGRSMYFVRSGFVDLVMDGAVADTVYPGGMFGEVALLAMPPVHALTQVGIHCAMLRQQLCVMLL